MVEKSVQVKNPAGLHARPASIFVTKANQFKSDILIHRNERAINAKSIIAILSLGITCGTKIRITADGPDESTAVEQLANIIETFTD